MQRACTVSYCHLWFVWLHHIFPHYLMNCTIFGKKFVEQKVSFVFINNFEIFLILIRFPRVTIISLQTSSCREPVILFRFLSKSNLFNRFAKNAQIPNCMKIRPLRSELFHADGQTDRQTDRHDETNNRC
jgi:hypothetical protein